MAHAMADEVHNPFTVVVCGGGHAAQVAAALFGARYRTIVVSFFADEAARWRDALGDDEVELELDTGKLVVGRPDLITDDPSVAQEADCIILAIPSFAHGQYLAAFGPYVKPGTVFAGMPARCGMGALAELGEKARDCVFIGFETLPWACRSEEWGRRATILAAKRKMLAATLPPMKAPQAIGMLQGLLGVFPCLVESPNMLGISLRAMNMIIHPGIMYGRWCQWDGEPMAEKPLFYQGVDDFTEEVLQGLTDDIQAVRRKLEELVPGLDLRDAVDLRQWYLDCYSGQMSDTTSIGSCMRSNAGYRGLTHPMRQVEGVYVPDFKHRYLTEDVPGGMCFYRGLAEILGVPTPTTDKVIAWAEGLLGMSILVDGRMSGADVAKTRAPQGTGIATLPAFLEAAELEPSMPVPRAPKLQASPPDVERDDKFTVLVCGGGTTAQAVTAMFASTCHTLAISIHGDEAERWTSALNGGDFELTLDTGKKLFSRPEAITNDPSVAAKADAIVLAVPSHAHEQYFEAFAPHLKPHAVVAVMPARSGADLLFASKLGEKAKSMTFVGFESVPWACRRDEWGRKATILGTKEEALVAVAPACRRPRAFATLQGLVGIFPHITEASSALAMSLRNPAAIVHPGVMYGRWCEERWDGQPLAEKPLFYHGVDEFTEAVLLGLSSEVQAIRRRVEERAPGLDLRDAVDLKGWYEDRYAGHLTDTSSLRACMTSNRGWAAMTHPMLEHAGGRYMPNLTYKYLAEDVRTGLCFARGLGELVDVPTPTTDKVLTWAQEQLGLTILVDGRMAGPDVAKTRAPQAMGITTFAALCRALGLELEGHSPDAKRRPQPPPSEEGRAKRFKHSCFLYPF